MRRERNNQPHSHETTQAETTREQTATGARRRPEKNARVIAQSTIIALAITGTRWTKDKTNQKETTEKKRQMSKGMNKERQMIEEDEEDRRVKQTT